MHSATSPTGMMSFTTTYAPTMTARSSCANGRTRSEKSCASHEKSWPEKCGKTERTSDIATLRRFLPAGASRLDHSVGDRTARWRHFYSWRALSHCNAGDNRAELLLP